MLQAIFYYLVTWWFVKLENKRSLTIRAVLAAIIAVCNFALVIGMIFFFSETQEEVTIFFIFLFAGLSLLFLIRSLRDIAKIRELSATSGNKQKTSAQNEKHHNIWL